MPEDPLLTFKSHTRRAAPLIQIFGPSSTFLAITRRFPGLVFFLCTRILKHRLAKRCFKFKSHVVVVRVPKTNGQNRRNGCTPIEITLIGFIGGDAERKAANATKHRDLLAGDQNVLEERCRILGIADRVASMRGLRETRRFRWRPSPKARTPPSKANSVATNTSANSPSVPRRRLPSAVSALARDPASTRSRRGFPRRAGGLWLWEAPR